MIRIIQNFKLFFLFLAVIFNLSCNSSDNGLIDYAGSPDISLITVQQGTTKPKITWSGGFVSVIGTNRGDHARLDTSLIWLIKTSGNNVRYPIEFASLPAGSQNLISSYSGTPQDKLGEDLMYTYWVAKDEVWDKISGFNGKVLKADPSLYEGVVREEGDTVWISQKSFETQSQPIDIYPNITNLLQFGRLADINIRQAADEKGPVITWQIKQADVTDSRISAIGIVVGSSYSPTKLMWEVYSLEQSDTVNVYGKKNVIDQPLYPGDSFDSTKVFAVFDLTKFIRGENYYVWIANESWNGTSRSKATNFYAYATFTTW